MHKQCNLPFMSFASGSVTSIAKIFQSVSPRNKEVHGWLGDLELQNFYLKENWLLSLLNKPVRRSNRRVGRYLKVNCTKSRDANLLTQKNRLSILKNITKTQTLPLASRPRAGKISEKCLLFHSNLMRK